MATKNHINRKGAVVIDINYSKSILLWQETLVEPLKKQIIKKHETFKDTEELEIIYYKNDENNLPLAGDRILMFMTLINGNAIHPPLYVPYFKDFKEHTDEEGNKVFYFHPMREVLSFNINQNLTKENPYTLIFWSNINLDKTSNFKYIQEQSSNGDYVKSYPYTSPSFDYLDNIIKIDEDIVEIAGTFVYGDPDYQRIAKAMFSAELKMLSDDDDYTIQWEYNEDDDIEDKFGPIVLDIPAVAKINYLWHEEPKDENSLILDFIPNKPKEEKEEEKNTNNLGGTLLYNNTDRILCKGQTVYTTTKPEDWDETEGNDINTVSYPMLWVSNKDLDDENEIIKGESFDIEDNFKMVTLLEDIPVKQKGFCTRGIPVWTRISPNFRSREGDFLSVPIDIFNKYTKNIKDRVRPLDTLVPTKDEIGWKIRDTNCENFYINELELGGRYKFPENLNLISYKYDLEKKRVLFLHKAEGYSQRIRNYEEKTKSIITTEPIIFGCWHNFDLRFSGEFNKYFSNWGEGFFVSFFNGDVEINENKINEKENYPFLELRVQRIPKDGDFKHTLEVFSDKEDNKPITTYSSDTRKNDFENIRILRGDPLDELENDEVSNEIKINTNSYSIKSNSWEEKESLNYEDLKRSIVVNVGIFKNKKPYTNAQYTDNTYNETINDVVIYKISGNINCPEELNVLLNKIHTKHILEISMNVPESEYKDLKKGLELIEINDIYKEKDSELYFRILSISIDDLNKLTKITIETEDTVSYSEGETIKLEKFRTYNSSSSEFLTSSYISQTDKFFRFYFNDEIHNDLEMSYLKNSTYSLSKDSSENVFTFSGETSQREFEGNFTIGENNIFNAFIDLSLSPNKQWFRLKLNSSSGALGNSAIEIEGIDIDNNIIFGKKPSDKDLDHIMISSGEEISGNGYGVCSSDWPLYVRTSSSLNVGDVCGTTSNSHKLNKGNTGFLCYGEGGANALVRPFRFIPCELRVKTESKTLKVSAKDSDFYKNNGGDQSNGTKKDINMEQEELSYWEEVVLESEKFNIGGDPECIYSFKINYEVTVERQNAGYDIFYLKGGGYSYKLGESTDERVGHKYKKITGEKSFQFSGGSNVYLVLEPKDHRFNREVEGTVTLVAENDGQSVYGNLDRLQIDESDAYTISGSV